VYFIKFIFYQSKFHRQREFLFVEVHLYYDNHRGGHHFSHLVGANGVVLKAQIRKDDKPAESESDWQHFQKGRRLSFENAAQSAYLKSKAGDNKVHQGESDVGEADVHVHPFV
jgi:hypothetical protein